MKATRMEQPYTAVRRQLEYEVPFPDFTRALESLLGRMDPEALPDLVHDSPDRARTKLGAFLGLSGFALFQKIEHGYVVRALGGRGMPATTYVIGNALVAYELTKHEPAVGLYVPPRVLVSATDGGVAVSFDVPSATLGQFELPEIDEVAIALDARLMKLLDVAAALAVKTRARRSAVGLRMADPGRR